MRSPFIGSEAVRNGSLRPHQLRSGYTRVFPDVYIPRTHQELTLREKAVAEWLWSHRQGVLAGLTAASWHGSKWIDEHLPMELIWSNARPPRGIQTFDVTLQPNEFYLVNGLPVTTPQRTAYDIGRRKPIGTAIAYLDALMGATGVKAHEVAEIAEQQLDSALELVDTGSQSLKETWLRLLLIRAGLPRPKIQIPVLTKDGAQVYYLDMGWEGLKVAVEYDGEHHRLNRGQYTRDVRRSEALERLGWLIIRVVVTDRPGEIIRRVRDALEFRASKLRTDRDLA
ncbi:endonuclease domain-containing protein [Mycobacterium riyadhense]|uniref:endonuclease domain-containing protein n=1 Tax=Mycobacterium riyadhense TaxID=486698 RepID=UPI00195D65CC|nr:DUF559 domain-containing protein [Mycobacterium riyadhense]